MSAGPSNPSHLLLSRHPRSPAHPQLAPTWTSSSRQHAPIPILGWSSTDTSPEDASRTRSSSAPLPPFHPSGPSAYLDEEGGEEEQEEEEAIDIHPTFLRDAPMPGRTKVIVGRSEFWCHKEVLWFASPFFQALLQGSWAETTHQDPSSAIYETSPIPSHRNSIIPETESVTDTDLGRDEGLTSVTEVSLPTAGSETRLGVHDRPEGDTDGFPQDESACEGPSGGDSEGQTGSVYLDASEDGPSVAEILRELRELPDLPAQHSGGSMEQLISTAPHGQNIPVLGEIAFPVQVPSVSHQLIAPIAPLAPPPPPSSITRKTRRRSSARHSVSSGNRPPSITHLRASASRTPARDHRQVDAMVELHEESAAAFQDFLFWAYPHLECKVTWTNVENLLALACKLIVPALQKSCEHFLLTHASGRPVMALSLAEQHGHTELFREASRFVLDQPTWNAEEMEDLSEQTQLRLSQRRTWFLERLLKLGSIDVRKEYTCRPDCPDPARCQFHLDEKWRQAHSAVCRYGPPQPSVAFRCLRQLETFPTNPSLVMPHPLCQSAAKSWVMTLFDRMFQPKAIASPLSPGTEKYWLFITLN